MFADLVPIVSLSEVRELSNNSELIALDDTTLQKYVNQVTVKVRAKIDKDQFLEEDSYDIPDDLKIATVALVDSYYVYTIVWKQTVSTWKKTSYTEKIDDYSISESYSETTSAFDYFWIPIDQYSLMILMAYMDNDTGLWNINLH